MSRKPLAKPAVVIGLPATKHRMGTFFAMLLTWHLPRPQLAVGKKLTLSSRLLEYSIMRIVNLVYRSTYHPVVGVQDPRQVCSSSFDSGSTLVRLNKLSVNAVRFNQVLRNILVCTFTKSLLARHLLITYTPTQRKNRPAGVVSKSGNIRGCFPDVFEGVTVSDKLRELLVNPDSENADAFSEDQQQELLFHVFRALSVGGGVCQSDDNLEPYTVATKALYKVRRHSAGCNACRCRCCRCYDWAMLSSASKFAKSCSPALPPSLLCPPSGFTPPPLSSDRTLFPSTRIRRLRSWRSPRARSTASPRRSPLTASPLLAAAAPRSGRIRPHQSLRRTAFVLLLSISRRSALPCCGKSFCRSGEGERGYMEV